MRILYGVVGEGMGHATRSKVVCEHLVQAGHEVKIVVSGRAHGFLSKSFPRRRRDQGADDPLRRQPHGPRRDARAKRPRRPAACSRPTSSAYFAQGRRLPPRRGHQRLRLVRVPLRQAARRCRSSRSTTSRSSAAASSASSPRRASKVDYQMTKAFVRAKLPGCDHYVITTFFYPPMRSKYEKDTTLVPPILRAADPRREEERARRATHVLVYQTSTSDTQLLDELERRPGHRVRRLRPAQERAPRQLHAQGVQRGGLRATTWRARARSCATAASRSSARPCTSASPSSASR